MIQLEKTLGQLFLNRLGLSAENYAIGRFEAGALKHYTFEQYAVYIARVGKALELMGLHRGDKVAILSNTRYEWNIFDLAIQFFGGVVIPIYHTYTNKEISYIYQHSECSGLIVENHQALNKFAQSKGSLFQSNFIVSLSEIDELEYRKIFEVSKIYNYSSFLEIGRQELEEPIALLSEKIKQIQESDVSTIIYTSGTTGTPKGAILSHKNIFTMLKNIASATQESFSESDSTLIWLPLSHVFGRADSYMNLLFGLESIYVEAQNKLIENLSTINPTMVMAVPRVFEKIYVKFQAELAKKGKQTHYLFNWAQTITNEYYSYLERDETPPYTLKSKFSIADKLFWSDLRKIFGDKVRFLISGGAPLSKKLNIFFRNCGLSIIEGYGLTETAGAITLNPLFAPTPGSAGTPIGEVEITISEEDNEILVKSDSIFQGYYRNSEESEILFDEQGWFHTGDLGRFDEKGQLFITGRKKDILITSGGKNIAPQKIDNIMSQQPNITHFVTVGDGQNYLVGLVSIEKSTLYRLAGEHGLRPGLPVSELAENHAIRSAVARSIHQGNRTLAPFETIKRFKILPTQLSIENGFLTPSMKVKRSAVIRRYQRQIKQLYNDSVALD